MSPLPCWLTASPRLRGLSFLPSPGAGTDAPAVFDTLEGGDADLRRARGLRLPDRLRVARLRRGGLEDRLRRRRRRLPSEPPLLPLLLLLRLLLLLLLLLESLQPNPYRINDTTACNSVPIQHQGRTGTEIHSWLRRHPHHAVQK
jgi:hypothetical protein